MFSILAAFGMFRVRGHVRALRVATCRRPSKLDCSRPFPIECAPGKRQRAGALQDASRDRHAASRRL